MVASTQEPVCGKNGGLDGGVGGVELSLAALLTRWSRLPQRDSCSTGLVRSARRRGQSGVMVSAARHMYQEATER
jgi:hypothetical protein